MSANPHRRGLLALLGAGSVAAAAGGGGPAGRVLGGEHFQVAGVDILRQGGLLRFADEIDRAIPAPSDAPEALVRIAAELPDDVAAARFIQARAVAALATAFPAEIAAYRSFSVPMRRRLYAELLARQAARVVPPSPRPSTPSASPGPDA